MVVGPIGVLSNDESFDRAPTTICPTFDRNHVSILYRFRDLASYLLKVAIFSESRKSLLLHVHGGPVAGVNQWNINS